MANAGQPLPDELPYEVHGDTGKNSAQTNAPLISRKAKASRTHEAPTFLHDTVSYKSLLLSNTTVILYSDFNILPKAGVTLLCHYLGAVIEGTDTADQCSPSSRTRLAICEGKQPVAEAKEQAAQLKFDFVIEIRSLLSAVCRWEAPWDPDFSKEISGGS
eukprot:TRINITY_DN16185_c0_g1_i1.p1 TRINITY_DN16185_c0_g1~~TRINITY_DN16185_c0_g1_i1.p1  ORF type:complete len:186 (+),score=31.83 TRINITY_DN16185_c0_g1_i1:79-558(+)